MMGNGYRLYPSYALTSIIWGESVSFYSQFSSITLSLVIFTSYGLVMAAYIVLANGNQIYESYEAISWTKKLKK